MATIRVDKPAGGGSGSLEQAARDGAAEAAPWIVRLARVGFAAKGIVYLVVGGAAVMAAAGAGGGTTDSRGALGVIGGSTAGRGLLLVMGIGLVGYALWALLASALDAERRGNDMKSLATRIGQASRGLIYGALGVEAIRLFATARPSSGDGAEHWTARVLALPFGRIAIGVAGASIIGYALYQLYRAAAKSLTRRMEAAAVSGETADRLIKIGRFGIAARAVVFLVIGWFLIRAAYDADADRAGGIDESLAALASQPYGPVVLGLVAFGLMAYGVWEFVKARYRVMALA
jgi:hypothetical protein